MDPNAIRIVNTSAEDLEPGSTQHLVLRRLGARGPDGA
jgi:hypothetical protein